MLAGSAATIATAAHSGPALAGRGTAPWGTPNRGVNLPGLAFGTRLPGVLGTDYQLPGPSDLDYFRGLGMSLIRLSFLWERIQPRLNGPLDPKHRGYVEAVVDAAAKRHMTVLLDVHNYARYRGQPIGDSAAVPYSAFEDLWVRLARAFRGHPGVFAYGLMNEPQGLSANTVWFSAAQRAVDAIRTVDRETIISVGGYGWSQAVGWTSSNEDLDIHDPSRRIIYEAHTYFDSSHNWGGLYNGTYDSNHAYTAVGVDNLGNFLDWLRRHDFRGILGEYGVPGDDPRWLGVLEAFLSCLARNGLWGTYWAGGPGWGTDPHGMQCGPEGYPAGAPQIPILKRFAI